MRELDECSVRLDTPFELDLAAGDVHCGAIRYVLMRPDVLMGLFSNLEPGDRQKALDSLETSAYQNGQASMREYQKQQFSGPKEMLDFFCESAARLGWGSFSYEFGASGAPTFKVSNSPFSLGFGPSETPVCAPIAGILRAFIEVFFGGSPAIQEVSCSSQGNDYCQFEVIGFSAEGDR
ncbi:MAG: V4R domain-containing protein [Pseudomonadota bacterium]